MQSEQPHRDSLGKDADREELELAHAPKASSVPALLNPLRLGPTLLPANLAALITTISLTTKLSIRATAFFIEMILESAQYGTSTCLGLTRRTLVSAISAARNLHLVKNGLGWASGSANSAAAVASEDTFMNVLDRWTNLGLYVIHHAFTLAELFTISSFYLTSTSVRTGVAAAQESVSLFNGLFGSSESSRALASIISLVRKEVLEDAHWTSLSNVSTLTNLTKSLAAFACLQNATSERTASRIRQRVLFDCTVVGGIGQRTLLDDGEDALPTYGLQSDEMDEDQKSVEMDGEEHRLAREIARLLGEEDVSSPQGSSMYEITEELTEELVETVIEQHHLSRPDQATSTVPFPSHLPARVSELGADWVDVEESRDGDEVMASPTGSPTRTTRPSLASLAYNDALEHPQSNSMRFQVILKTITRKLREKRTIIRRLDRGSSSSDAPSPMDSPGPSRSSQRSLEWVEREQDEVEEVEAALTSEAVCAGRSTPRPAPITKRISYLTQTPQRSLPSSPSPSSTSRSSRAADLGLSPSSSNSASPCFRSPAGTPSAPSPSASASPSREQSPHLQQSPPSSGPGPHRVHSTRSVVEQQARYQSQGQGSRSEDPTPPGMFPKGHLLRNIHKFCRFSSAAYGQSFLRILGLGATDFVYPSTEKTNANAWAFARHTNLPIDALLLSSHVSPGASLSSKLSPLVHFVAVDHDSAAIVLTCRGTLGLSDVLVDLCCEYERITVDGGDPEAIYQAHGGMLYAAQQLMSMDNQVHETIRQALERYPTYGLVLTGHSLGGGVASLLAMLWSCPAEVFLAQKDVSSLRFPSIETPFVTNVSSGLAPGRPIHCYVYGPPCVASIDLARHAEGLVSSIVQGTDIVPSLSLGVLRDFKNVATTLKDESNVAEEIVARVIGVEQRRLRDKYAPSMLGAGGKVNSTEPLPEVVCSPEEIRQGRPRNCALDQGYRAPGSGSGTSAPMTEDQRQLDDWFASLINTMRADMSNQKLYPAGRVYTMEHWTVFATESPAPLHAGDFAHKEAHRVVLKIVQDVEKRFSEPIFSRTMLHDHVPTRYEQSTQLLFDGMFGSAHV